MNYKISGFFLLFIFSGLPLSWAEESQALDKPAKYFFYRCAGCHTVGGGNLAGPDLQASTQWSDGDLKGAIKRMEKNVGAISAEEIDQMVQFLRSSDLTDRLAKQKNAVEVSHRESLPPASFEMGQRLFRGEKAFQNGGPACLACHRVGSEGGMLGPDLTFIKDRLSGVALQSAIENSSFKVMRPIYEKRKVTGEEALHIAEYLAHPEKTKQRFAGTLSQVVYAATAGFGLFFILLWFLNKKIKLSARKTLLKKNKG